MLIRYEMKKMFSKPANLIVLLLLVVLIGYSSNRATRNVEWVDSYGNWETGHSAAVKLQQARAKWTGTLDQEMLGCALTEIKQIYNSSDTQTDDIEENWIIRSQLQGVQEIADLLSWSYGEAYGSFQKMIFELQPADLMQFYENRLTERTEWLYDETSWGYYNYTEEEKQYVLSQYEAMETPLEIGYHEGWVQVNEQLPSLLKYGILLLSFLLAGIFSDEFTLKTDAIFYNTLYGRTRATTAKIILSFLLITVIYWLSAGAYSLIVFGTLGTDGGNYVLQSHAPYWFLRDNITFAQKYWLSLLFGYIGYLFIGFLVMWISAKSKSAVLAVLIPSIIILLPDYLSVDRSPFMFYVIGILPDRLLDCGKALNYLLVYSVGDRVFTSSQILFMSYPCFTILLIYLCYREYRYKQIT